MKSINPRRPASPSCLAVLLAVVGVSVGKAQVYNATTQFSKVNNPSGVWTYGYSGSFGAFIKDTDIAVFPNLSYWNQAGALEYPIILHNDTASNIVGPGAQYPVDALTFGPSGIASEQYAILRFTAPVSGAFNISVSFTAGDFNPTTTDVHVLQNGVSLYDAVINSFGPVYSYNPANPISLSAGGNIDFLVGNGGNGPVNDSTSVRAIVTTVTVVPEPSVMALGVIGGLGLLVKGIRRRR